VERRAARRRPGAGIPFGLGRISYESGLYMGPMLLYRAEEGDVFNFTGVAARPEDQPWPRRAMSFSMRSSGCYGAR
jgi:hypothetical protein